MAVGKWSSSDKALSLLLLVISCAACASGTTHIVGGSSGWKLNVNYDQWTSSQTFLPGDFLQFRYNTSQHDVVEVNSDGYSSCSSGGPSIMVNSDNTTFTLSGVGTKYFICGISNHCISGMRLQVNLIASSTNNNNTDDNNNARILSQVHAAAVVCAGLLVVGLGVFYCSTLAVPHGWPHSHL